MAENEYLGRAEASDYEPFMALINDVFFSGKDFNFLNLLPKLYKQMYDPCGHNVVLKADGAIKAAVGIFEDRYHVAGEELLCCGIGNVAVHKDARRKGYMIKTMNRAMEEMQAAGADFSVLGGNRQRYEYFSFAPVGQIYRCTIVPGNLRSYYDAGEKSGFTVRPMTGENPEENAAALSHYKRAGFYADRAPERMIDILHSWNSKPYAVYDAAGIFVGYYVIKSDTKTVFEIKVSDDTQLPGMLKAIFEETGGEYITYMIPPFDHKILAFFAGIAERISVESPEQFTVFHFKKVVSAFLKLKMQERQLCCGSCVLLIRGISGNEQIKITVSEDAVAVEDTTEPPELELEHLDAMGLLFAVYSPLREKLSPTAASWFPLPLFFYECDSV